MVIHSMKRLAAVVFLAGALAGGCQCPTTVSPGSRGVLAWVNFEDGAATTVNETGVFDLGTFAMGSTVRFQVGLRNVGGAQLSVDEPQVVDGGPVGFGAEGTAPFLLSGGRLELGVADTQSWQGTFQPPREPGVMTRDHESVVRVQLGNSEASTATLTLKARAVSNLCDVPRDIDFGGVARGDTAIKGLTIRNLRNVEVEAQVFPVQPAGTLLLSNEVPRGKFRMAPNSERVVNVLFRPTDTVDSQGIIRINLGAGCPDQLVNVRGTGVEQVVRWTPSVQDFGFVPERLSRTQAITFFNRGTTPVQLTEIRVEQETTPVRFAAALPALEIPPGGRDLDGNLTEGQVTLDVTFSPGVLGLREATLRLKTSLPRQGNLAVPLRGVGGGADIDVKPAGGLNLRRMAYFPNAPTPSVARGKFVIQNVGNRAPDGDVRANLRLGVGGRGPPYFRVEAKNADTSLEELCVGRFDVAANRCTGELTSPQYYDLRGIEAGLAQQQEVPVRVTPRSLGLKEFEVVIFSDDADEPEVRYPIRVNVVNLPPCEYEVRPATVNFGRMTPPGFQDRFFSIRNRGVGPLDTCLISGLDVGVDSDAMFSLVDGPMGEVELPPGGFVNVAVRASPPNLFLNGSQRRGTIEFNVSSPRAPAADVTLLATLGSACLVFLPAPVNFGTVKTGCTSPDTSLNIYNACGTPVTISSVTLTDAAGVPPGVGGCAGTAPCPEFGLGSTAGVLGTLQPGGAPRVVTLRYAPRDLGPDTGGITVVVGQDGDQVEYTVGLLGIGGLTGANTDSFRQAERPKSDILVVVDNSCSMADKQVALGANLRAFLDFAAMQNADLQLGVTSSDSTPSGLRGSLRTTMRGNKIFTRNTADLDKEWDEAVKIGTGGSGEEMCLDPALRALTAPKITDARINGGFLRPDADLAIICITDAEDQSPFPPSYYAAQFVNIKGGVPDRVTINAVAPLANTAPPGCLYDPEAPSLNLPQAARLTNGVLEEICTTNWSDTLKRVSRRTVGLKSSFQLKTRPDLENGALTVALAGVEVPRVDGSGNVAWRYDPATNSVVFSTLYVPEPGRTLTISYQSLCILGPPLGGM